MPMSVFVSYSHENAAFANRLRQDLQAHGVHVWIDHESLAPGTPDWDEAIRHALRSVDAVLFIASPEARKSRFVRDELHVAQMYQRTLYPVWATGDHWIDCVPIGWGATQYVDARGASYTAALDALLGALGAAPAPITPSAPSIAATSPASPTKSVFEELVELQQQIEMSKQPAQAHAATPTPSYDLSRLRELLAARNVTAAHEESKMLLRRAAHLSSDERIDSEQKALAIPADLLRQMDGLWRAATGTRLRRLNWIRFPVGGLTSYAGAWWQWGDQTWLLRRLNEVGC